MPGGDAHLDQAEIVKKILHHLGLSLGEQPDAQPVEAPPKKEITVDPSYSQLI